MATVNWRVLEERSEPAFQAMRDESPQAAQYDSDAFGVYAHLIYDPGQHQALPNKSQTYAVEGCNAELRHYLSIRLMSRTSSVPEFYHSRRSDPLACRLNYH